MILDLGFPGPFLILSGGCSDWTGAPLQSLHAGLFPNARMEVTEGAGHDTAWDRLGGNARHDQILSHRTCNAATPGTVRGGRAMPPSPFPR